MCMNIEIASIIFEICIVPVRLLLARDYSWTVTPAASFFPGGGVVSPRRSAGNHPVRYGTFLKLV